MSKKMFSGDQTCFSSEIINFGDVSLDMESIYLDLLNH